jgi:hypothetical protein
VIRARWPNPAGRLGATRRDQHRHLGLWGLAQTIVPCRHRCRQANLRVDGEAQHNLGLVDATECDGARNRVGWETRRGPVLGEHPGDEMGTCRMTDQAQATGGTKVSGMVRAVQDRFAYLINDFVEGDAGA